MEGNGREYPLEFWGYYAGFVQGDSRPPVEDVYAQWLADKEKERQEAFKAWQEAKGIARGEPVQKEGERNEAMSLPEGTMVANYDAGANAETMAKARNIPYATDRLDRLMAESERKYKNFSESYPGQRYVQFYDDVRTGGVYDLKSKPGWKESDKYIYNGEIVNRDAPGNIHFGWYGKVNQLPDEVLVKGAGAEQIWSDLKNANKSLGDIYRNFNWDSFGDDPRDTSRIRQGIEIYKNRHRR